MKEHPKRVKPVLRGNLYMLALLLYTVIFQTTLVALLIWLDKAWFVDTPWVYFVLQICGFGIPFAAYCLITKTKVRDILPHERLGTANAGYIAAMCLLLSPVMMLISGISALFFPSAAETILNPLAETPLPVSLAAVALMPAIFEEITFRGIILTNHGSLKPYLAALLNGVFFGIIHLNFQQMPYAMAIGAVFALFVMKTRSVYSSMLAHLLINGSQVLLNAWARSALSEQPEPADLAPNAAQSLGDRVSELYPVLVVAVFAAVGFVAVYRAFARHNEKKFDISDREGFANAENGEDECVQL